MKNMNARKRVSFGSKGSMVETLIIEDIPNPSPPATESHLNNHINIKYNGHGNATVTKAIEPKITVIVTDTTVSRDHTPVKAKKVDRTISSPESSPSAPPGNWPLKRSQSVDSRDNPFLPGGELDKEAEDLLARATIIRDQFILKDSDQGEDGVESPSKNTSPEDKSALPVDQTDSVSPEVAQTTETALANDARPKENGKLDSEDSLSPGSVRIEEQNDTSRDKKKQKKCCVVM